MTQKIKMLHQLGLKMELITGITLTKCLVRTTQKQTVSMETQIFNAKMIQMMRHLSLNGIHLIQRLKIVLANIQKYKFQKEQKRRILNTCGTKWDGIRPETEELMLDFGMLQEDIQTPGLNADGILKIPTIHTSTDLDI